MNTVQEKSRDSPVRLPIIPLMDLPRYHQHAGSLAARLAMENGYVLDTSAGRIVGRIDVGEVLATLRTRSTNGETTDQAAQPTMEMEEETKYSRPSGFFPTSTVAEHSEEPLAATG